MNIPDWAAEAIDRIRDRGFDVAAEIEAGIEGTSDLSISLAMNGSIRRFSGYINAKPQASLIHRLTAERRPILLSPRITRHLGRICRDSAVPFADSAGNMFIAWDRIHVDVEGLTAKPDVGPPSTAGANAFGQTGLKIIFCLLSYPGLAAAPLREISDLSSASLGATQKTLKELTERGYLETSASGGRRLHRTRELFDRWTDAYLINLEPRLVRGKYTIEEPGAHLRDTLPDGVLWGGEAAAAISDRRLRPATLTIYASSQPTGLLGEWHARRAAGEPNVILRNKFWANQDSVTVPPTLIYADLLAAGDPRQMAAARTLRESHALLIDLDRR